MKLIKFDLPIDGTKVRNIEELRDHFSTEILDLYKDGLLVKWLGSHGYKDYKRVIENIASQKTEAQLLRNLCDIFDITVDEEMLNQLTDYHKNGIRIDPDQLRFKDKFEHIKKQDLKKRSILGFNDEFICSTVTSDLIIKMHKIHTGDDIVLVPVVGKLAQMGNNWISLDDLNNLYAYRIGEVVKRASDLFKNNNAIYAPCDGALYKKVYPPLNTNKQFINNELIFAYLRVDM